jgi:hypothetical protein
LTHHVARVYVLKSDHTQVFHDKLQNLLSNLRNGHYFPGQEVVYIMNVIEYQHRGMPHAHIVVRLSGMPSKKHARDTYCMS